MEGAALSQRLWGHWLSLIQILEGSLSGSVAFQWRSPGRSRRFKQCVVPWHLQQIQRQRVERTHVALSECICEYITTGSGLTYICTVFGLHSTEKILFASTICRFFAATDLQPFPGESEGLDAPHPYPLLLLFLGGIGKWQSPRRTLDFCCLGPAFLEELPTFSWWVGGILDWFGSLWKPKLFPMLQAEAVFSDGRYRESEKSHLRCLP